MKTSKKAPQLQGLVINKYSKILCILIAAELYPIIKKRPELYVTARVYTLAVHILIRATYDIFTPLMDSSVFANPNAVYYWGLINITLHVPYLFWYFYRQYKSKLSVTLNSARS